MRRNGNKTANPMRLRKTNCIFWNIYKAAMYLPSSNEALLLVTQWKFLFEEQHALLLFLLCIQSTYIWLGHWLYPDRLPVLVCVYCFNLYFKKPNRSSWQVPLCDLSILSFFLSDSHCGCDCRGEEGPEKEDARLLLFGLKRLSNILLPVCLNGTQRDKVGKGLLRKQ